MKSKIEDAFQIRDRWIEEVALVKTEMTNFLRCYSDVRIPTLQNDVAIMEAELSSRGLFDMSGLHCPFDTWNTIKFFAITNAAYKSKDESMYCHHRQFT